METQGKIIFLDIRECIVWNILEFICICLPACLIRTDSIWILFCIFSSYHIFWLLDMKHYESKIRKKKLFPYSKKCSLPFTSLSFLLRFCSTPVLKTQHWSWKIKQSALTAQEHLLDIIPDFLDSKCIHRKKIGDMLNFRGRKTRTKMIEK